jgi:hypothetical protein
MKKPLTVYLIVGLIFATAVAYFIAASFGERLERPNHEAKAAVETGHESSEVTTPQPQTTKNNQCLRQPSKTNTKQYIFC